MKVADLVSELNLKSFNSDCVKTEPIEVSSAYCGDLLSDVMAHIPSHSVWFTVQAHINIIAVAQLRDVSCIVLANGSAPDLQTLEKARELGVNLYGSQESSASMCMKLAGKF